MTRLRTGFLWGALCSLLVANTGWAQGSTAQDHQAADTNGDSLVDRSEFQRRMVDVFYFQDGDRDGRLTPDELPAADTADFAGSDTNGDGALQLAEFLNARAKDFARADKNGDGSLSEDEAITYR